MNWCNGFLVAVVAAPISFLIPQEYQGNPKHPVQMIWVEPSEIATYCGTPATRGFHFLACERGGVLVMPNPCRYPEAKSVDSYAHLECHEKAHVLGWAHEEV